MLHCQLNVCDFFLNADTGRDFAFSRAVSGLKKCDFLIKY